MNDPISRCSAINVVNDALDEYDGGYNHSRAKVVYDALMSLPTGKLERPKGKWIDEGFYADGHGAHAFRCSECGGHIIEYFADPFCKWCGSFNGGEDEV